MPGPGQRKHARSLITITNSCQVSIQKKVSAQKKVSIQKKVKTPKKVSTQKKLRPRKKVNIQKKSLLALPRFPPKLIREKNKYFQFIFVRKANTSIRQYYNFLQGTRNGLHRLKFISLSSGVLVKCIGEKARLEGDGQSPQGPIPFHMPSKPRALSFDQHHHSQRHHHRVY